MIHESEWNRHISGNKCFIYSKDKFKLSSCQTSAIYFQLKRAALRVFPASAPFILQYIRQGTVWIYYIFSIYLYTLHYIEWKWRRKMQITMRVKYKNFIHACVAHYILSSIHACIARESFRWNFQLTPHHNFVFNVCTRPM